MARTRGRGSKPTQHEANMEHAVGLPHREFLYTPDQIAAMLDLETRSVYRYYLHYWGRSVGRRPNDKLLARNIAPDGEKPEWRIAETEFVRWLRRKGFYLVERSFR